MKFLKYMGALLFAATLAACGGGGGSAGTPGTGSGSGGGTGGGGGGAGGTATATVTDFALFTDKTTINNSGTDKAQLTVVAVDANRNVVSGAVVAVSTDQNSVFAPAAGNSTDATGTYLGNLTIGGDKSDRNITLAVTINGITKNIAVRVAGTRLTIEAAPATPSPGQAVLVTARLTDSAGNGIQGATVTFGGNIAGLAGQTVVTGVTGIATRSITSPNVAGIYTITASAFGVSSGDYQLSVFSSSVPAATIPAGASPSLAATPNVLAVNSPGSTTNRTTLRFLFLSSTNVPVQNVRVRFEDRTTGLPAIGASIASGTSTLYTDASGSVSTQYISGQNSSPTNGVTLRACYSATDFTSASDCPNSVLVSLTTAGQALALSIGDDNLLAKGAGTYIKNFAVTVADSAGRAVANAPVDISVDLTHFAKSTGISTITQLLSAVPAVLTDYYPDSTTEPTASPTGFVWCANEDRNRNGNVDPGENVNNSVDSNGQPTLEPRKSDLIVSYADPAVTTTNASGILVIKVEYSQRFARWLAYKVRVTANVAGSQGLAERLFVTDFVEGDKDNGSFHLPPYGEHACNVAN